MMMRYDRICYLCYLCKMRYLIERLQYVHNDLQDANEIAIYDKYGKIAKRVTVMLICKESIH
jgi:predicted DCC family thiol-disulfide oxidoreductase YuxK